MRVAIRIALVVACLGLLGCGGDELAAARADADRWRLIALIGIVAAVIIGMAMGSKPKS